MLEHAIRMKERVGSANKLRNYDTDGYIKRAGCICFRTNHAKEILLVTSNRYPDKWIVPAGGVEAGERFQDAAVREVFEEAGVRGNIMQCLGVFQNETSKTRTKMYVLHVTEECDYWDDAAKGRRRGWFSIRKAWELLSHRPCQQLYLRDVMKIDEQNQWLYDSPIRFSAPLVINESRNNQSNAEVSP